MKKFLLVFLYEYKRHVFRKRFIFAILSMPLMVGLIILVGYISAKSTYQPAPIGYIDTANLIPQPRQVPVEEDTTFPPVPVERYESEDLIKQDLTSGKIQAYFILGDEYMNDGLVMMVTANNTGQNVESDFGNFLRYNLTSELPVKVATRLTEGNELIVRSLDGTRELNENNWFAIILPILSGVLFIIAVNISGGYLLQAVVEEKENRTMEIIVTSVSPTELMAGKIVGDLLVGLTQLVVWVLFVIIGLRIAPQFLPMGQSLELKPGYILLLAGTFLPAFVMIAAQMGAVGSMATDTREAQQISGLFTLPMVVPLWFTSAIMFTPNGAISVALSLFPFTAPLALPLRAVFTTIPAWQIALSLSLLYILSILSIFFAGKVFRMGMLRYGKRLTFKEIFARAQG